MNNDKKDYYVGGNRAERRKKAHKNKPFAAIEEKRLRSKMKRKAKNASKKRNKGGQG